MKRKLVIWGEKGNEEAPEKVLIALELLAEKNQVNAIVFDAESSTKELEEQLMNQWRKDEAVAFPENHSNSNYELSAGGSLLPDDLRSLEKGDLLKRTQTEWLFAVLSTKLFKTYESELHQLQDQIDGLSKYNKGLWSELKNFQSKINAQVKEQNLFREHTNLLRDHINELFGKLKDLRRIEDEAYESAAKESFDKINQTLLEVENAITENNGDWGKCFDQLKSLQHQLKNARLTRDGRSQLWERIDKAFKAVKERRFGSNQNQNNRLERRIEGLKSAIQKMENSIGRDEKELNFQHKKLNSSNATQLESQLREVRAKLIQEKLDSKKAKLADMHKTLEDLNARMTKIQKRQEEEAKKAEAKAKEAEEKAKEEPISTPESSVNTDKEENTATEETDVPKAEEQPTTEESAVSTEETTEAAVDNTETNSFEEPSEKED